jgi:hypothetical protein
MDYVRRMRPMSALAAAAILSTAIWGCGLAAGVHSSVRPLPEIAAPPASHPKTAETPPSAFFPDAARLTANPAYPFARSWVDPSVDFTRYRALVIAPVSLAYLRPVPASAGADIDAHGRQEAALQAAMQVPDDFEKAAARGGALKVRERTGAGTVVASMAIVQLVPSRTAHDAGQQDTQLLMGTASSQMSRPIAVEPGEIAMETILRDGGSNKVVAMFADTQRAQIPPSAKKPPSDYDFAARAIDEWTREVVHVIYSTAGARSAAASGR